MPAPAQPFAAGLRPHRRALTVYALAHHPTCSAFAQDMVGVRVGARRLPVCVGCLVTWPTFLAAFPALTFALVAAGWPPLPVAAAGVALASA
ncbi:MAG TPA: hypothetical protein VFH47_03675, partial [Candidatus Thermoplasmatota archaeon]|nr:hypothetical protein [Candidatus Thermoplasmatota archaeon]